MAGWRIDPGVAGVSPASVGVGGRVIPTQIGLGFDDDTPNPFAPGLRYDHRSNQVSSDGLGRASEEAVGMRSGQPVFLGPRPRPRP